MTSRNLDSAGLLANRPTSPWIDPVRMYGEPADWLDNACGVAWKPTKARRRVLSGSVTGHIHPQFVMPNERTREDYR